VSCDAEWHCSAVETYDEFCDLSGCDNQDCGTVYRCPHTPLDPCDVGIFTDNACSRCSVLTGWSCSSSATNLHCTLAHVSGEEVCDKTLSNECNPFI
jgi:hypothetical protein